jgi:hypothetical protein
MTQIKLSIKINNKKPIELNELTSSLNALAREYDLYCNTELNLPKEERKLEIIKLEEGCIYMELLPIITPLIQEMNSVFCFGKYIIETLDYFTGKATSKPNSNFKKKNCDNVNTFLDQTANDNGSNTIINVVGNNNTTIIMGKTIDSLESNAAQNSIAKYKTLLLEEESGVSHKQAFYWEAASFSNIKNIKSNSDKGIIEKLDKKPHKVIFENDIDKDGITQFNQKYRKDWQNLIYIVDVEAIKVQDVIRTYKILKVYTEDTIDPDDS